MRIVGAAVLTAVFAVAVAAPPAGAQVGWGDAFQISAQPPDPSTVNSLSADAAFSASDGETLVAYTSDAVTDGTQGVRVRRLSPSGAPTGDEAGIEALSGPQQSASEPRAAADPEHDRWLVVFTADTNAGPGLNRQVFGQLLDGAGNQIGPDDQKLSVSTGDDSYFGDVAYSAPADRYLVVFCYDPPAPSMETQNVYGQLVTADGAKDGGLIKISDAPPGVNFGCYPSVAVNAAGEFLVVFQRTFAYPRNAIYRQRVSAAGAMIPDATDVPVAVPADGNDNDFQPAVAHDPGTDRFLVAWPHFPGVPGIAQVRGRLLAADASEVGEVTELSESASSVSSTPSVAGGGSWLVAWPSTSQLVTSDGAESGPDETIPGQSGFSPRVERLTAAGKWLAVYSAPSSAPGTAIFGRLSGGGGPPAPAPPPSPAPTPAPTPTAPAPTPAAPKPPAFATLVSLPSTRRCVSRRSFRIRLRAPKGVKVTRAVVSLNGKRVKVVTGKRLTAPVDLRGLPKGRFTVKIAITVAGQAKPVSDSRRYRTCAPKR